MAGSKLATIIVVIMTDIAGRKPRKLKGTSVSVERALREFGRHVATWRRLERLPVQLVAERAGISRDTLRAIETGRGSVSLENCFRVLRILGVMDGVVRAADPYETEVGRRRADEILPQRVRS